MKGARQDQVEKLPAKDPINRVRSLVGNCNNYVFVRLRLIMISH